MTGKGIIETLGTTNYGEIGNGNPNDPILQLEGALPTQKDIKGELPKAVEAIQSRVPEPSQQNQGQNQGQEPAQERQEEQEKQMSVPAILAEMFKEDGIDLGEIDDKASIKDIYNKAKKLVIGDPDELAEKYAKRKGLTDDVIETSKMLNSGKLRFPEQEQYNKLSSYANFKYEIPEEASEGEKNAIIENAKRIVEHYYDSTLKGKAKQIAIANIDDFSDDFADLVEQGVAFAAEEKEAFRRGMLDKITEEEAIEETHTEKIKEAIKKGDLFGSKLPKEVIEQYMSSIFDETETITYKDGTTDMVSKYTKNLLNLKADPIEAAKIMIRIAEGAEDSTERQMGKREFGSSLEQRLATAVEDRDQKIVQKQLPLRRGVVNVLQSRSY